MMKPTQAQIERYGDISIAIRQAIDRRGWTISQLNEALGKKRDYPSTYKWVNGNAGPGGSIIPTLARVLNISPESLRWRGRDQTSEPKTQQLAPIPKMSLKPITTPNNVATFNVTPEGMAHIKFEWTMPIEEGNRLFRSVIDTCQMTRKR